LVLDRAGNAEREVELGLDDLARLADLLGVRDPARIDRRTGRAHRATEGVRDLANELEPLLAPDAAPAGNDDPGLLDRQCRGRFLDPIDDLDHRQLELAIRLASLDLAGRACLLGSHDVRSNRDDPTL